MPTDIQWTDETWNCVRGCSRVSSGCGDSTGGGCYAERQAYRFSGPGMPYEGLVRMTSKGPRWTGKVVLVPEKLEQPLHWKRPRRIFVNSMSDLFHESLTDEQIDRVFAVISLAHQHVFQVLTKRPARMLAYFSDPYHMNRARSWVYSIDGHRARHEAAASWPLPNVWLGVSVEDQKTADERIPLLLQTPAAVRWISAEPLLGPLDISKWVATPVVCDGSSLSAEGAAAMKQLAQAVVRSRGFELLDWVVVGAESGPNARPFDLAWARLLVEQCKAAGVPVFVKQLGQHPIDWRHDEPEVPPYVYSLTKKGGDPSEWPEDLRVREFPTTTTTGMSAKEV